MPKKQKGRKKNVLFEVIMKSGRKKQHNHEMFSKP